MFGECLLRHTICMLRKCQVREKPEPSTYGQDTVNFNFLADVTSDTDLRHMAKSLYEAAKYRELLELLELQPDSWRSDVFLLNLAGACLLALGSNVGAERHYRSMIASYGDNAEAYCNLGLILQNKGDVFEAELVYKKAISISPDFPEAYNNLGLLYMAQGNLAEAEAAYRKAIAANPTFALAFYNLGNVLLKGANGRDYIDLAEAAFRKALENNPNFDKACNTLGGILLATGRYKESEAMFLRAISIAPRFADAHFNLGRLYHNLLGLQDSTPAESAYRHALTIEPNHAAAHGELGRLLRDLGSLDEGIAHMRRAVDCAPNSMRLHSNLVYSLMFQAEEGATVLEECRRWATRYETPLLHEKLSHKNEPSVSRRIRVGYVSPDFRDHCQSLFTTPLLRHHNHEKFEIFLYSFTRVEDEVTRRISTYADVWRDVKFLSDLDLAKQINDDRIDILIDLTMHMADARPLVFARRPSPIQVAWLAYPGTTGMSSVDYRLTDLKMMRTTASAQSDCLRPSGATIQVRTCQ